MSDWIVWFEVEDQNRAVAPFVFNDKQKWVLEQVFGVIPGWGSKPSIHWLEMKRAEHALESVDQYDTPKGDEEC